MITMKNDLHSQTLAVDLPFQHPDAYGSISMPVYHTAAYEFPSAAAMTETFTGRVWEPDYSRVINPTVAYFENKVQALTGAHNVFAFSSGMAAIANLLMAVASSGKSIITSKHLFGNTLSLMTHTLARFGVETRLVDLTDIDAVEQAMQANTCCIFLEIITNPQLEVADLIALAEVAHSHYVPLIADTTMIPFTDFSARSLGVDVEVVSSTKYLGAGSSLGGLVIDYGTFPEVEQHIRHELLFNAGAYMTPDAAAMQTQALETLAVRYSAQVQTTHWVAQKLQEEGVSVNAIFLPSHPQHELARRQFGEAIPAMFTIDLRSEEHCYAFINHLQLVRRATNLFDNKSLAIHPYSTIFGLFTAEEKRAMDVLPTTIRLSMGLEHPQDIFNDLIQAIHAI